MADRGQPGSPSAQSKEMVSLVVPVYNEAENILPLLELLATSVESEHETLLVYDFDEDTTLPPARDFAVDHRSLRLVRNEIGPGVLNALKTGLASARGDVVIVTMADLSDDVTQIDEMASMVRRGAAVVSASRYMRGGRQVGGPVVKRTLSRIAGLSLRWLTGIGTHDPTNNFKAYSRRLLDEVDIESRRGFEIGLELTTKAHLLGHDIEEVPTKWHDRTAGTSRFQVLNWLPAYLQWYTRCVAGSWSGRRRRATRDRSVTSAPRLSGGESKG